jgi:hypothetical protein
MSDRHHGGHIAEQSMQAIEMIKLSMNSLTEFVLLSN